MMGSPEPGTERDADQRPRHSVTIARPFAVSRFAVTVEQQRACAQRRGCRDDVDDHLGASYPSTGVSWNDAQSYVTWLSKLTGKSYRLLSEAEYEYAARAGSETAYPWGDDVGQGNANCAGCGSAWDNRTPAPVGSFAANGFGLYDMVGNVLSFVEDCYHDSYVGAPADGTAWVSGACDYRIARGGSFGRGPEALRSAERHMHDDSFRDVDLGFRVARDLDR